MSSQLEFLSAARFASASPPDAQDAHQSADTCSYETHLGGSCLKIAIDFQSYQQA